MDAAKENGYRYTIIGINLLYLQHVMGKMKKYTNGRLSLERNIIKNI